MLTLAAAGSSTEFTGLVGWVVDVVAAAGPLGVALLLALDNVAPIVPSEVVLPFAGYLSAQGQMSFALLVVASSLGSTLSAYVYFEVGRRLGPDRARAVLLRVPLTDTADIERATAWFERHGQAAVFTGRFVPLVRSLVSLPAGMVRMGRLRFGLLTLAGSGLWNTLWLSIGRVIGQRWERAGEYSDWFNGAMVAFLVIALAHYVWKRRGRLRT